MLAQRYVSIAVFALSSLVGLAHPAGAFAGNVTLNWDPSSSTEVAGYRVYRTETAGIFPTTPLSGTGLVTSNSFQDTTAQQSRTYYYAVTAVSRTGTESNRSNVVQTVVTPPNLAPVVNAGTDRTITLPSATNLSAIITDDGLPGGQLAVLWSVVQGSGVSIASPQTAATQVSFATSGVYTLRVTAGDGQFTSSDDIRITVNPRPNTAPTVNAGPDQTITLRTATLTATAADDGLPTGQLTYQWSVVQGSGVSIGSPTAAATQVSFSTTGVYTLRVTASDGQLTATDNVNIVVNAVPNVAPTVSAGPDQTTTLRTATLTATATDDGLPNGQLSYQWSVVQGTGVSIASPQAAATQVSFSNTGAYTLRVTASDGQLTATDNVNVMVNAAATAAPPPSVAPPPNAAPTVSAGTDQTITLRTATLTATATDDGLPNGQLSYQWSVVQGTGVSITSPQAAATQVSFSNTGSYTLRVNASDGQLTASDTVNITVNAAPNAITNAAPTVTVGPDQNTSSRSANLTATANDDGLPNGRLTYQWSVVQGSGVSIASPQSSATQVSFAGTGAYKLRVAASDGQLSSSADVNVNITAAAATNVAPTVNAGPDQMIPLRDSVTLSATASDDGQPNKTLTYQWSVLQGSGVTFKSPNSASTTASFRTSGIYALLVIASDGQLTSSDEVVINVQPNKQWSKRGDEDSSQTVTASTLSSSSVTTENVRQQALSFPATVNQQPVVNAGADRSVRAGYPLTLTATATDDGLPGNTLTYQWTVIQGLGASIAAPQSASTSASFSEAGAYVLRVTASDGSLSGTDDVRIQIEKDVVTDFLRIVGISSSVQLAIIQNANTSARVSDAVLKSTTPIRNGRINATIQDSHNVGVVLANPNAESVVIHFNFADEAGSSVHAGQLNVPAGGMSSGLLNDSIFVPQQLSIDMSRVRSFSFSASAPVAAAAVRTLRNERQDLMITSIPVADVDQPTGPVTFPFYADGAGWQSEIQLVNTSSSSIQGVIRLLPSSNPDTVYDLAPHSARVFRTSGAGTVARTGWMQVIPTKGTPNPAGSLIITNKTNGVTTSMGTILSTPVSALHHVYAETSAGTATEPGQVQTTLTIVNPSSSPVSVMLELLNLSGQSTQIRGAVTIAAQDTVSVNVSQIPGMQDIQAFSGIVRITGDPVTAAGFLSRSNQFGETVVTAIPAIVPGSTSEKFLFAADGGGYSTQIKNVEPPTAATVAGN